jgi:hypothetical protein
VGLAIAGGGVFAQPRDAPVRVHFERVFREFGVPLRIRSDNGPPFASTGLGGLSALSVWWIKLGILPERIEPGQPQQNGRHERMHRTLKAEATIPPQSTLIEQQRVFDRFRGIYFVASTTRCDRTRRLRKRRPPRATSRRRARCPSDFDRRNTPTR